MPPKSPRPLARSVSVVLLVAVLLGASACRSAARSPSTAATPTATVAPVVTAVATTSTAAAAPTTGSAAPAPSSTAAPVTLAPAVKATGSVVHGTLSFGGRERTYRLYVPASITAGPVPLVIALHGGTGWGDQFAQTDHVEGFAEANHFIVVHPDGVKLLSGGPGGVWNGGVCCGVAARQDVDDVGFIAALIDQISTEHPVDPHRVYAFGHSNGAIMSYRLACQLSDRIAAIGLYAGTLGVTPCAPAHPVSVLHIHGTADTNIPIDGGTGSDSIAAVDFPSPRAGFATLAGADGCPAGTTTVAGDLTSELAAPCAGGAAAEFVTIAGAHHAWPGGTPVVTPAGGAGYAGYDATAAIVAFLLAHPRA